MGHGAQEVDPVADARALGLGLEAVQQLPAARDDQVHLGVRAREPLDGDVKPLEVMGPVERGHERRRDRLGRDPQLVAHAVVGTGREERRCRRRSA